MALSFSHTGSGGGIGGGKAVLGFPSINPHYSLFKIPSFNTHIINYGNKVEQRIARDDEVKYMFKLRWKILNQVNANRLLNFFISMRGSYEAFYWDNPEDNTTYLVRFGSDMMNLEYFTYQLYTLQEVTLVQIAR